MRTYLSVFEDKQTAGRVAGILKEQGVDPNQMAIATDQSGEKEEWPEEVQQWQDEGYAVLLAQTMEYLEPQVKEILAAQEPLHMQVLAGLVGDESWMDDMRYVPTPHTKDLYVKRFAGQEVVKDAVFDVEQGLDYDERRSKYYQHYNQTYAATGVPFERYDDAYRFGELLAGEVHIQSRQWDDIAKQGEERWTHQYPAGGAWEDVQEAIRFAWRVNRKD